MLQSVFSLLKLKLLLRLRSKSSSKFRDIKGLNLWITYVLDYLHLLTEGKGPLNPSIADNTETVKKYFWDKYFEIWNHWISISSIKLNEQWKPEMAGVRMPSPMSMHIPSTATNSNILRAMMLRSRNFPSLPGSWLCERSSIEFSFFDGRMPMLMCLQSKEYMAKVPPAVNTNPDLRINM